MKISMLMKEYMEETSRRSTAYNRSLLPESFSTLHTMPVEVVENHWKVLEAPERLARKYEFNTQEQRALFLNELLHEESAHGHFAKITIEGLELLVEVWTHDLERVTELDQEYAEACDSLYNDVMLMRRF